MSNAVIKQSTDTVSVFLDMAHSDFGEDVFLSGDLKEVPMKPVNGRHLYPDNDQSLPLVTRVEDEVKKLWMYDIHGNRLPSPDWREYRLPERTSLQEVSSNGKLSILIRVK